MLALKITDIRDFTNKLFIGEVFDKFCLSEAVDNNFQYISPSTADFKETFLTQTA